MLKHEDNSETPSQSAAQVRVTPEELAAAISRLEARKDADQRQVEGTIPIGEAVQQLGLDATPEEILAEVQAGHAITPKRRAALWDRLWISASLGMVILGGSLIIARSYTADTSTSQTETIRPAVSDGLRHIPLAPNLLVGDAFGKFVLLSEVGNEQPVHCGYFTGGLRRYTPGGTGVTWTLIKHGGRVYIRGWMLKMSPKALAANGAGISASRTSSHVVPVTLPVNGFMEPTPDSSGTQMYSDTIIPAEDVHLDKHAYEKWQP